MIHWESGEAPALPYYTNIFHYYVSDDLEGYEVMDDETLALVKNVDGFLGYESFKSEGRGSFISYWRDKKAIDVWRKNTTHQKAKSEGKKRWYRYYHSMLVKVESFNSKSEK